MLRKISNEFYQGVLTIITFLVIFEKIASKLEKMAQFFSSLNPFPSLPSLATDRKQFQCHKIVLNNKTSPLFLEFNWCKTLLAFKKYDKIMWRSPFKEICKNVTNSNYIVYFQGRWLPNQNFDWCLPGDRLCFICGIQLVSMKLLLYFDYNLRQKCWDTFTFIWFYRLILLKIILSPLLPP